MSTMICWFTLVLACDASEDLRALPEKPAEKLQLGMVYSCLQRAMHAAADCSTHAVRTR